MECEKYYLSYAVLYSSWRIVYTMRFLGLKLVYVLLIPYQFLNYTYWQYARQVTCIGVNEKQYLR